MILYRCFPWDGRVDSATAGALAIPRQLQGEGRHDRPERYGCLYASEEPLSAVVEELARFSGTELAPADLRRGRLPLALAALELADTALLVDLDDPRVLAAEGLRPSLLAAAERSRTQAAAAALYERHEEAAGLRWWSAFEPRWANVTLFDRARTSLTLAGLVPLDLGHALVARAARFLGLRLSA